MTYRQKEEYFYLTLLNNVVAEDQVRLNSLTNVSIHLAVDQQY